MSHPILEALVDIAASGDPGIGTLDLESEYLLAANRFALGQCHAQVIQEQPGLDLALEDAGLAYKILEYQRQMRAQATYFSTRIMPSFIQLFSDATNFNALIQSAIEIEAPQIRNASRNAKAKTSSEAAINALTDAARALSMQATKFGENLAVVDDSLRTLEQAFRAALDSALNELVASAKDDAVAIDGLTKEILKNITDIVTGAEKVGGAITELGIGVLTTISNTKADAKADPKKDKKEEDKEGKKNVAGSPKSRDAADTGTKAPLSEFAVKAIEAARSGADSTALARAQLNTNNEALADRLQSLAEANSILSIAKVVQVQNGIFTTAMGEALAIVRTIASTWGTPPDGEHPGAGISLGFSNFSTAIAAINSQQDADALASRLTASSTEWDSLRDQLAYLKSAIIAQGELPNI